MTTVYFSYKTGRARLTNTIIPLGQAHYSHFLLGQRVLEIIRSLGLRTEELVRPEIYGSVYALSQLQRNPLHIAFKAIEEFRTLKGARNILCTLWEFDKINEESRGSPLNNHRRLLSACDEVWCYCGFTREVLSQYHQNVHLIRVPFPIPDDDRDQDSGLLDLRVAKIAATGRVEASLADILQNSRFTVLSVLNPHDWRKNLANILKAFELFQLGKKNTVLLIKMVVHNSLETVQTIREFLQTRFSLPDNAEIYFLHTLLSETDLMKLYRKANFYLCASHCEGLCMPLIEAMGQGVVPISVQNTAMRDYISEDNAFCIRSRKVSARIDSNSSQNPNLTWYDSSPWDIVAGLESAYQCSDRDYLKKQRAAISTIRKVFSKSLASDILKARIEASASASSQESVDGVS